jgi:hypothetical protein
MSQLDPNVAAFRARMQQLRSNVPGGQHTVQTFLRMLILSHLERVSSQHLGHPGYAASTPIWSAMLDESVLDVTCRSVEGLLGRAFREGVHVWETHRLPGLFLIMSGIPAVSAEDVRSFFERGYFLFLEETGFLVEATRGSLVHWLMCSDVRTTVAHLTCLPSDHHAIALLPTDILTMQERINIGLV